MCPHTRAIPSLLCLFLCSVLFGCSDAVLIQVEGRPENTRALRVSATLDGVGIGQDPLLLTPAPSRVVLKDLPNPQGELEVRIEALVDQCIVASGTARLQVSLPSLQWTVASVHLDPLSPKHCPVAVELHGMTANLTLTAQPPARFDCPHETVGFRRCQAYFPVGEQAQINLQGTPEGAFIHRSYPHPASDPPQALPYSVPVEEIQEEPQRDLDLAPPNTLVLRILKTQLPTGYAITGLWGTREEAQAGDAPFAYEHLWAVGDNGHGGGFIAELGREGVLHSVYDSPYRLNAISGRHGPDKNSLTLWAIGDRGTILRKQETAAKWEIIPDSSTDKSNPKNLNALWIDKDTGDTWIVGDDATVLRSRDGGSQVEVVHATQFSSDDRLTAVARFSDGNFVIGGHTSDESKRHPVLIAKPVRVDETDVMDRWAHLVPFAEPLIAAIASDAGDFMSTTRLIFTYPAVTPVSSESEFPPRTSLWAGDHKRVWSGAGSLERYDIDSIPPWFKEVRPHPPQLLHPVLAGHSVKKCPFFMDIWVVTGDAINNRLQLIYGP